MASEEDSNGRLRSEDVVEQPVEPEGPFCVVAEGCRRPPDHLITTVIPAAVARETQERLRATDAAYWQAVAAKLDRSTHSGKIMPALAAELARTIRDGLIGNLPCSWVPVGLEGATGTSVGPPKTEREVWAVAYYLAAKRKLVTDTKPTATILKCYAPLSRKQWDRWRRDYTTDAEILLDDIVLQHPAVFSGGLEKFLLP